MAKDEFILKDFKDIVKTEKLFDILSKHDGELPEYLKIFREYLKIIEDPDEYYEDEFNAWLKENPDFNELLVNSMDGSYNGFKAKTRKKGQDLINEAIERGELDPLNKTKCCICGKDKGIREYHCEDYSEENIIKDAVPLCKHCHMYLHQNNNKHDHPEKWEQYKKEVRKNRKGPWYDSRYWTEENDGEVSSSNHRECPKL